MHLVCNPVIPKGFSRQTFGDLDKTMVCLFVCLGFNGTFSTNRLYSAIKVGK